MRVFFFQAEDGIRDYKVTGVQTCALPIYPERGRVHQEIRIGKETLRVVPAARLDPLAKRFAQKKRAVEAAVGEMDRSEEHTSELQSPCNLVCRLLLAKKTKCKHSNSST